MYFTVDGRANYYDCDWNNCLKISAAMKYMEQVSSEQLEYLGFSPDKLLGENMVFLLSKMCIKVHRMPRSAELLRIGTAPVQPRRARFVREFVIDSAQGERLISALSLWVLVNPHSRKVMRPASFPYPIQFQSASLTAVIDDVELPKDMSTAGETSSVAVRYSHIDSNRHVNNTVYADLICDALPGIILAQKEIDTLVISFQNEAIFGDTLDMSTHLIAEDSYFVSGTHNRGHCFQSLIKLR